MNISERKNIHRKKYLKLEIQRLKEREAILLKELTICREEIEKKWKEFNDKKEKELNG